jgi:feruloyl esterase
VDDGLIQNPTACAFDPYSLVCKPGQDVGCLSTGQADTLNACCTATRNTFGSLVYPGFSVSNLATSSTGPLTGGGANVWSTGLLPSADVNAAEPWGNAGFSPSPVGYQFGDHIIQDIVTQEPTFNIRDYPVPSDGHIDDGALETFDARTDADAATVPESCRRFIRRGGKLIIYHGYSDPALTPFRTTALRDQLAAIHGGYGALQSSVRLFMVPGMQHCIGGPGPNVFDTLTPLDA